MWVYYQSLYQLGSQKDTEFIPDGLNEDILMKELFTK